MWEAVTDWVAEHLGRPVRASLDAGDEGQTCAVMVASGVLGRSEEEWAVIDPPAGASVALTIGDGSLLLFEGAVEDIERDGTHLLVHIIAGASLVLSPVT